MKKYPKEVFSIGLRLIMENVALYIWKPPDRDPSKWEISMAKAWNKKLEINSFDNSKALDILNTIWKPLDIGSSTNLILMV